MKKKFYAVKKGRTTGIFETWEECAMQTSGYAGAQFRGFATERDAALWLAGAPIPRTVSETPRRPVRPSSSDLASCSALPSSSGYTVYTDGSCLRNPEGPGGWACVIQENTTGHVSEAAGGSPSTTNNRMEMTAVIEALKRVPEGSAVALFTDSQYVKNGLTKWIFSWKRRHWLKANGEPVLNKELWIELDSLCHSHRIDFHWVKGHAGIAFNERCDQLAKASAAKYTRHPLT